MHRPLLMSWLLAPPTQAYQAEREPRVTQIFATPEDDDNFGQRLQPAGDTLVITAAGQQHQVDRRTNQGWLFP